MCWAKSPNIPPPPPPVQESKQPATAVFAKRKNQYAMNAPSGGTLLTSDAGTTRGALNTGAPTLLGG